MKRIAPTYLRSRGGTPPPKTPTLARAALFSTRRLLARHEAIGAELDRGGKVELSIHNASRIAALRKAVELIRGTPRR